MAHQTRIEILAPMLAVPDVEGSVAYYRDKLGFEVRFVAVNPGLATYAVVVRDNYEIHLMEGVELGERGAKGGVAITVDDINGLYEELKARGAFSADFPKAYDAIREHPPEDKEYGRRDLIMVEPNGYILVFGQPLADE